MSRTDKDAPSWVRAKYATHRTEWHYRCEHSVWALRYAPAEAVFEDCTIDQATGWCRYFVDDRDRFYYDAPSSADKNHWWFGPDRAATRDVLKAAVRDFNTYGDTDIEPENRQARGAPYGGGWWD